MDIATLIAEAKQGSRAAQKCLFDQFAGQLLVVCKRYVKNAEDAEECLLDGFYQFFVKLSGFQYQGDGALYTWLKGIMVNRCLMFLRKKTIFNLITETEATEIEIEEAVFHKLSADEIFHLIVQLPVGYRTVFNLAEMENMKHSEIALSLNISEGTSKSQLSKAKKLLQKSLQAKGIVYEHRKSK
jgi:RNA polymerase sigma-70 factor (ECF subfamily)